MTQRAAALLGATLLLCAWAVPSTADPWNERTVLKIDEPVMVPGATLQPGTYVLQIGDATNARHTVRITRERDNHVIATVQAVPTRRETATDDIVLKFDPTKHGAAPALKGWFYPGRLYGHEFIYPEDQARQIAERTHTLVLADDARGDMSGTGTLHVIDARGVVGDWHPDAAVTREWENWNRTRQTAESTSAAPSASASTTASAATGASDTASAALVQADRQGMPVKLDDLEDNPSRYIGKRISVDGEVDDLIGPRIFKLDEPGWADVEGELLVVLPAGTGALLKENDRVTVSGTVRQFVRADVDRDWGWLNDQPDVELKLARKPVIVADRIIGGDDNRTLIIRAQPDNTAVGTSGAAASGPAVGAAGARAITDPVMLATGDDDLVGRPVHLDGLTVTGVDADHGFYVGPREHQVFVLTQYLPDTRSIDPAQKVTVDGFVMQMPAGARSSLKAPGALNKHIYVYATALN